MRRVCLAVVANSLVPLLMQRLPRDTQVTDKRECFDMAATVIKLEGDGLPDWCNEPINGGAYVWGMCVILGNGNCVVLPAQSGPATGSLASRIAEQYGHRN